eukprot:810234_1
MGSRASKISSRDTLEHDEEVRDLESQLIPSDVKRRPDSWTVKQLALIPVALISLVILFFALNTGLAYFLGGVPTIAHTNSDALINGSSVQPQSERENTIIGGLTSDNGRPINPLLRVDTRGKRIPRPEDLLKHTGSSAKRPPAKGARPATEMSTDFLGARSAIHAGSWYSDKPAELKRQLDGFLNEVAEPTEAARVRAIIVP